jgi:hypothetical protein
MGTDDPDALLATPSAADSEGNILKQVTHIVEDPEGDSFADQFPWAEKRHTNIKQMLGDTFLKSDGSEVGGPGPEPPST